MIQPTLHADFWVFFANPYFWSAFLGWCTAQIIKMVRGAIKMKTLDFTYLLSTGGMPSAHSALVMSLFVSLGLGIGWTEPATVVASVFAAITMFDAATVRRAAGLQARVLNKMVAQFKAEHRFSFKPLKELLGHTRTEVFGGMLTGTLVAIAIMKLWLALDLPNL